MTYDYAALISEINTYVNTNGVGAITGAVGNMVLKDIVDSTYNKVDDAGLLGFQQHDSTTVYGAGQMVQYQGLFSLARRAGVTGAYSSPTDWRGNSPGNVIGYQLYAYPEYNPALSYLVNTYVKYEHGLYKANQGVAAGVIPTNATYWDVVYVNNNKFGNVWQAGSYASTDFVVGASDGLLYKAATGAPEWISTNFASDVTAGYWVAVGYLPLAGGNMSGNILFTASKGIDTTATGGTDTLNIGATNADVINIGRAGATVNVLGTALYEYAANQYVLDKLITLNYGGAVSSGAGVGFEVEENSLITGYFKTNVTRDGFVMLSPANIYGATFSLTALNADHTYTLPDSTGTLALRQDKLSVFAATTSAELAGVISDETGTGALVFGTSPTFTTTITVNGDATINTLKVGLGGGSVASNTVLGYQALNSNTTGSTITAIGYQTGYNNTIGQRFVALGYQAMYSSLTMSRTVAIGFQSQYYANSSGSNVNTLNTAVGDESMKGSTTAANNTGTLNTAIGTQSMFSMTSGSRITALGYQAAYSTTSGSYHTAVGFQALRASTTVDGSVGLGYMAGAYETGANKFFVDNQDRTNEATGRTNSLLYGVFHASPASQVLTVNAALVASQALMTVQFNSSNYFTTTVAATGNTTFAITGGGSFTFSQAISVPLGSVAVTPSSSDNSTKIATTAYVDTKAGLGVGNLTLTGAGAWSSMTNGASAISQVESTTNKVNYFVVDFLTAVQSYVEWQVPLPADYNGGTITAVFYWTAASASTNSVVWGISATAFGDNVAIDTAFSAGVEVTDANNATGVVNISASTAAITIAGTPLANKHCQFRVYRLGSGADNLAATARLLEVKLSYTKA